MAPGQKVREVVEDHIAIFCPSCGTEWTSEAAFCGACGAPLMHAPEHAMEATAPAPPEDATATPLAANSAPPEAYRSSMPPAQSAPRQCGWCGAQNLADAARCVQCGAMFPSPEMDAAYLAKAQERIEDVQTSLESMRRNWRRRGFGRFFDN
jgi:hypothetical protein